MLGISESGVLIHLNDPKKPKYQSRFWKNDPGKTKS